MAICQGRQTRGLPIELCCHTWQGITIIFEDGVVWGSRVR